MGMPLRLVCIPSENLLVKITFSIVSGCQLEIDAQFGIAASVLYPLIPETPCDTDHCRPCDAVTVPVSACVLWSCFV